MKHKSLLLTLCIGALIFALAAFQSPAYAAEELPDGDDIPPVEGEYEQPDEPKEPYIPEYIPPYGAFTPGGSATVVDNFQDGSKEFYTFTTPAGNIFYLVIDRIRDQENVYFLNAVTEADLVALTQETDGKNGVSAIPPTDKLKEQQPQEPADPEPDDEKPESNSAAMDTNTIIFIVIAVALIGLMAYFKISKGKNKAPAADEADDDEDDEEYEPKRRSRDEDDDDEDDEY